MAWFSQVASLISDVKCCAMMRDRQDETCHGIPLGIPIQRSSSSTSIRFPGPPNPLHSRLNSIDSTAPTEEVRLPADFFVRLASLAVDDPKIAVHIEDDRTCPLIWGHASSLRFQFLQMCIRDRYDLCRALWLQLDEYDRREFIAVYRLGPPSPEYFHNIMVIEEDTWKEIASTDAGSDVHSVAVGSDNGSDGSDNGSVGQTRPESPDGWKEMGWSYLGKI